MSAFLLALIIVAIVPNRAVLGGGTQSDLVQLEELTNKKLTGVYAVPAQPQITYYAIDLNSSPPYALVDWIGYRFAGAEFVATKSKSGIWSLTFGSGGLYSTQELIDYGVPSAVATYLKANMKPLPTPTP
ncbi:MAG TPA: hypothetical protein VN934_03795 [Candidatus Tumulicola sp.]|nr:hypothetical protein [Candidatus Tumulicola sp.]